MQGYASLDILSQLILGYPNLQNLYLDIPGSYTDLLRVSFFQMDAGGGTEAQYMRADSGGSRRPHCGPDPEQITTTATIA